MRWSETLTKTYPKHFLKSALVVFISSALVFKCSICILLPPGVLGIWGEWLFIFRDLGSTGYYFRGAGEQAHSFGDLGSPAKKQKKKKIKEKPPFRLIF